MINLVKNNRVLAGLVVLVFILSTAANLFDLDLQVANVFSFSRTSFGINMPVFLFLVILATVADRNLNKKKVR
ncbi:MAG TPA: hypothetical protein VLN47_10390 [Clostridiaceae bacterium]|nr:hypothetical protein [Clostridiaceae bacterium]